MKFFNGAQIRKDKSLLFALILIATFILIALLAPVIAHEGSSSIIPFGVETARAETKIYQEPGFQEENETRKISHLLGTDQIGRDVTSRLIHGTRTTLLVGIISTLISFLIALLLGSLSGYYGDDGLSVNIYALVIGSIAAIISIPLLWYNRYRSVDGEFVLASARTLIVLFGIIVALMALRLMNKKWPNPSVKLPMDTIVMKIIEVIRGIPGLFLILAIFSVINYPSIWSVILVIGLLRWGGMTRLLRAEFQRYRSESFVASAKVAGLSDGKIIIKHLLPNAMGPMLVTACFLAGNAILIEAALSFLGIGVPTDSVSWGAMLGASRDYINAWWLAIFPGILIFLLILSFNILGDRLRKHLYMGASDG